MKIEKRIRKSFIRQHGINDCGKACLGMCISYYGGKVNLDNIHRLSGSTQTGTTLLGLFHAATHLGFTAEAFEVNAASMNERLTVPAILHVRSTSGHMHYVVLFKIEGDMFIIGDPGIGIEIWDRATLDKKWESRIALLLEPNKKFKELNGQHSVNDSILEWIKPDKSILMAIIFIGIIISVISLSTAIFSQQLIDVILPSAKFSHLIYGVIIFAILLVAKLGIGYVRAKLLFIQAKELNIRLIKEFFNKLLELPKPFFDSKKTGELISRINDTGRIQSTLSELFGVIMIEFLVAITSVAAIFYFDWRIGIIVSAVIPFYVLLHFRFQKSIIRKQKDVMNSYALNESNYIDTVTGISVIKSTGKHSLFQKFTNMIFGNFQEHIFNLNQHRVRLGLFSEAFHLVFYLIIIVLGGYLYFTGRLALGELIAVISLTSAIGPSLHKIALFNVGLQGARVAFDRMEEFAGIKSELNSGSDVIDISLTILKLDHISFSFPGKLALLNEIDLEIKKGNLISLIGESGVGKSTIAQLLLRFYSPTSGIIQLNDRDINDLDLQWYRKHVGYIGQDPKIFNNSLFFNICLTDDPDELEKVIIWCTANGFNEYFKHFPQKYFTLLGEEGINLSGGQQQLVSLARALYSNPQFLILDEATSALDTKTEQMVLKLLQRLKSNTGILLITHRINLAMTTDYIYRIENGEIINKGNPEYMSEVDERIRSFYHELPFFQNHVP